MGKERLSLRASAGCSGVQVPNLWGQAQPLLHEEMPGIPPQPRTAGARHSGHLLYPQDIAPREVFPSVRTFIGHFFLVAVKFLKKKTRAATCLQFYFHSPLHPKLW